MGGSLNNVRNFSTSSALSVGLCSPFSLRCRTLGHFLSVFLKQIGMVSLSLRMAKIKEKTKTAEV